MSIEEAYNNGQSLRLIATVLGELFSSHIEAIKRQVEIDEWRTNEKLRLGISDSQLDAMLKLAATMQQSYDALVAFIEEDSILPLRDKF